MIPTHFSAQLKFQNRMASPVHGLMFLLTTATRTCYAASAAKLLQLSPTLYDPIEGSPPGSPIPGILQARTLEWVAISFSNAWKWKVKSLSHVRPSATPWTAAFQAPLSMGFSRQEYWSGVPLPSPLTSYKYPYMSRGRPWRWRESGEQLDVGNIMKWVMLGTMMLLYSFWMLRTCLVLVSFPCINLLNPQIYPEKYV